MVLKLIFALVLTEKTIEDYRSRWCRKHVFDILPSKVIRFCLSENKSFLQKLFLSKCLELKAVQTLKISSMSMISCVCCGRDHTQS